METGVGQARDADAFRVDMKTCFGFMFWGLVLVALKISCNPFDVLPHGVGGLGYALVAVGTGGLASATGNFIAATSLSWLLVVASMVGMFVPSELQAVFGLVVTVLNCAMIWSLLGGIIDIATGRHRTDLAERAAHRRLIYVVLIAISTLVGVLAQAVGKVAALLALPLLASVLVVMVMILHLIHRVRKELSP